MPALPAVPNVLKVTLVGAAALDVDIVTRFFIGFAGSEPSVGQLSTFDVAVGNAWNTNLAAWAAASFTLTEVNSVDLTSATAAASDDAVSHAGSRAGSGNANDDCFVMSYEIARRYRGGHPRGYWYLGVGGDRLNQEQWTTGFVSNIDTQIGLFFTAVLAAGWALAGTLSHVNVSYKSGFTAVENPITGRYRNVPKTRAVPIVDPVTALIGRQRIGTQRRRNGKS